MAVVSHREVVEPPASFRRLAHRALDFASRIHGHSAHCFQGVEARSGRLVPYDTGDILGDYAVDPERRNDWSFVFLVELGPAGRLERLRLNPVRLGYAEVNLARGAEFQEICATMVTRAAPVGSRLTRTAEDLDLACPP